MLLPLLILLLLSGAALCSDQEYFLISQPQTWSNARNYCRQKHVDLAIFQDASDWYLLPRLTLNLKPCWIGLQNTQTLSWAWSLGGDPSSLAQFTNWDSSLPFSSRCGVMRDDGKWVSVSCSKQLPFVCQSERFHLTLVSLADGAGESFAVLKEVKTWHGAQAYCRQRGTDLVSVNNLDENKAVQQLIRPHRKTHSFWIGLFRSSLRWSDGSYSSFTNWYSGQPNLDGPCVAINPMGKWYDKRCTSSYCFYCYGRQIKKFIVKMHFKTNSKPSPFSDSALINNILTKIQKKLKEGKIQWRVQSGGKVFHKRD